MRGPRAQIAAVVLCLIPLVATPGLAAGTQGATLTGIATTTGSTEPVQVVNGHRFDFGVTLEMTGDLVGALQVHVDLATATPPGAFVGTFTLSTAATTWTGRMYGQVEPTGNVASFVGGGGHTVLRMTIAETIPWSGVYSYEGILIDK